MQKEKDVEVKYGSKKRNKQMEKKQRVRRGKKILERITEKNTGIKKVKETQRNILVAIMLSKSKGKEQGDKRKHGNEEEKCRKN